jgi:methionine synthase I (cobalamin-dependent)
MSHAELDAAEELDDGNPTEMGKQYAAVRDHLPWLNIFGGCCGTDLRHVVAIGKALAASDWPGGQNDRRAELARD